MAGEAMMVAEPSERAHRIAEGLIRTGRATDCHPVPGYLRLTGKEGDRYWISMNGNKLLRGFTFDGATEIQGGFANAMVRAGEQARRSV
jgi:hypothetical protein